MQVVACVDGVAVVWCEDGCVVAATVTETLYRRLVIWCEGWRAIGDGDLIEGYESACLIPYGTHCVAGADVCCQAFSGVSVAVCTVTVGDPIIVGCAVCWLTVPGESTDTVLCDHTSLVNATPWVDRERETAAIPVAGCFCEEDSAGGGGCADNTVEEDGGFLCSDVWDPVVGGDEVHGLLLIDRVCVKLDAR